jgi:hypothetical protein
MAQPSLNDQSTLKALTGETPDTSEYTDFNFYQFIIYYAPNDDSNDGKGRQKLARWLGPLPQVGQGLCYYLLKPNGRYIARSMVLWPITPNNYVKYPTLKDELKEFNDKVQEHIGAFPASFSRQRKMNWRKTFLSQWKMAMCPFTTTSLTWRTPTRRLYPLVKPQVILPHKGGDVMATVVGRKGDLDGNLIGRKHHIPVLDS